MSGGGELRRMFEEARADIEDSGVLRYPQRELCRAGCRALYSSPARWFCGARAVALFVSGERPRMDWCATLRLTALLPRDLRELEPLTPRVQPDFSDALIRAIETPLTAARYRVGHAHRCVQDLVYSAREPRHGGRAAGEWLRGHHPAAAILLRLAACAQRRTHWLARQWRAGTFDDMERAAGSLEKLDAIITNAAGCGSHLKHYDICCMTTRLRGTRRQWSEKLKDIHEWLVEIGIRRPECCDSS